MEFILEDFAKEEGWGGKVEKSKSSNRKSEEEIHQAREREIDIVYCLSFCHQDKVEGKLQKYFKAM